MNKRGTSDLINKKNRKITQMITGRKIAVEIGAAATIGLVAGIIFAHMSQRKSRAALKNRMSNAVITIKMHDLDKIRVERVE
jgi:hypothetical protein